MDYTTLSNILITYVPMLSMLLAFLASCIGVIRQLKKTDIDSVLSTIQDSSSDLYKKVDASIELMKQIIQENESLKKQNNVLIGELKRIADYEYKEE